MITGTTAKYGVVAEDTSYSKSCAMHNAAFAVCGIDAVYLPIQVAPTEASATVSSMRALGYRGGNVTVPYKEVIAKQVDRLVGDAATLNTVNTLVREGDEFVGHTTDGEGFIRSLSEQNLDPTNMTVLLYGAGGAARAVAVALARHGVGELVIANRTQARAEELVQLVGGSARVGEITDATKAELIVNATSLGMDGTLPEPLSALSQLASGDQIVCDLVYKPQPKTPFLSAAETNGARVVDGLGMLLHQAALSFELWTSQTAPLEVMRTALS